MKKKDNSLVLATTKSNVVIKSKTISFQAIPGQAVLFSCYLNNNMGTDEIVIESKALSTQLDLGNIKINTTGTLKTKEVSKEVVELSSGVVSKLKRSRTVDHEFSYFNTDESSNKLSPQVKLGGELLPELNLGKVELEIVFGEITKKIEKKITSTSNQSNTIEQEVTLDGSIHQKYELIWSDKICEGTAELTYKGKKITIPFKYKEGAELKVKAWSEPRVKTGGKRW